MIFTALMQKGEPMDPIDRQMAIDAAIEAADDWDGGYSKERERFIREALEALPSAQPEPQWIPCERELPEVGRSVLISVGGMYTAEGCLREDGDWTQFRWDTTQRKDMVGAWKPLDEPWRGEE